VLILGVSALYHDSAAALLCDGQLIAAAQEERFSRIKYDARFPEQAIHFCLEQGNVSMRDVDYVVFYEKPLPKFERILTTALGTFPQSWLTFRESMLAWLSDKLWTKTNIGRRLDFPRERILFVDHHLSHAASALFASPFDSAALLTIDGVGEWTTAAIGRGRSSWGPGQTNALELTHELIFPHSLGLLYSAFTAWLGFKVNSGEYKVMGMAPYGEPKYLEKVEKVCRMGDDGSVALNMRFFSFQHSLTHTYSSRFVEHFGPARLPESPFFTARTGDDISGREREAAQNQYYADVAASVQRFTEEAVLRMARTAYRQSGGERRLALAGGVALNSVANGRIAREGPFDEIFIQPNAGDAGGALGAALYVNHAVLGQPRRFVMDHAYYGQALDASKIVATLDSAGVAFERIDDVGRMADRIADELGSGKVVALAQGRFEWGPRALGNRSILADPRSSAMKETVNSKIKFRESFRPFAPAIVEEAAATYFEPKGVVGQYPARFMLVVAPFKDQRAEETPAVAHMGTGRVQIVRRDWNPLYYEIIKRFGERTGTPVILNTSFNLRGEPIVSTPAEALTSFRKTDMDLLVLDNYVVRGRLAR